uniref:Peptidase S1 domain-containing protein n=1 Tax=Bubo bubo TaxID=30461 RepID=A0A8C0EKF1_BUBBB
MLMMTMLWEAANCPEHSVPYWCPLNVGYHFCGGSLISNQWVLRTQMRMENTDVKEDSELVRRSLDNDIMLIKMATTMDYSADIQPTALPSSCAKEGPKCLFQTNFPTGQEAYPGQITSNMICLMLLNFSLQDDASGPAVCIGQLQGIVSWENECALKGYPSVYTKVCNYVD